jgi:hypothetical protein
MIAQSATAGKTGIVIPMQQLSRRTTFRPRDA